MPLDAQGVRTMAGGAAAGLLTTQRFMPRLRIDIVSVANGILAGLVAICAGCDSIRPAHAVIVGGVAIIVLPFIVGMAVLALGK